MKPVDQTTFGFPGGNCFSACVASLLHLAIDEVPYFMTDDAWISRFQQWLDPFGFEALCLTSFTPRGYHILSGQSPRSPDNPSHLHSVIAFGSQIVHDPHPDRSGLLSRIDVIVLIPFVPYLPT